MSTYIDGNSVSDEVIDNTTHRISDGSDHSFIDQDITISSTPKFRSENVSVGIAKQVAAENTGAGEDDLQQYTLLADSLDADGKAVRIRAWFQTAANANSKTVKLYFGATVIAVAGPAALNNKLVYVDATVLRLGATSQEAFSVHIEGSNGSSSDDTLLKRTSPAETMSGAIIIKGTGEGVATTDIIQRGMLVEKLA